MAKKIFLSPSNQKLNTYAYGGTTEDVQCGKIAEFCKIALERCGFEVKLEQYDTMQNRVAHSNAWGADLHVPIHTNAFNASVGGTRVFYFQPNTASYKAAQSIYSVLKDITPGKSDAMTQNTSFYEMNKPKAPAVYVEAEFHDVPEYAKWIINNTELIGESICKGICAYFGVAYKDVVDEAPSSVALYRVQVGAFSVKANADAMAEKIKAAGFNIYMVKVDNLYKIQVGAFSNKDNAYAMVEKLKAAGFDGFITTNSGTAVSNPTKSIDELAKEVIAGKWGSGKDRRIRLIEAGYDYDAVQERVNEILYPVKKKSVEEIAKEVIAGKWGSGSKRKTNLINAGYDYDAVQRKVNELL